MESERLVLLDLESTNGTFVNDVPTTWDFISPGDRIRLGSEELILFLGGTFLGDPSEVLADDKIISGIAENLTPVDLVQVLAANGKTGTLMFYKGQFGRIDFKEGHVRYAKVGRIEGEKAFHRILSWDGAEFQFRAQQPKEENIDSPTDKLLVDNLRQQDEMRTLAPQLPDPDKVLTLHATPGTASLSAIEEEILRLHPTARTLTHVMDASPHLDVEIARAIARLLEAGVLASTA
jgi:pSer/pThr/pTyr-binding forkhead associated (FHA) protein